MPLYRHFLTLVAGLSLAMFAPSLAAHGDEVHDHAEPAAPVAAVPPESGVRASAASGLFEAVAVLQGGELRVYVDRYDSNAPVAGAQVEIEGQGIGGRATEIAPAVYALPGVNPAPGTYALTITIEAASEADLLLLSLVVPAEGAGETVGSAFGAWIWGLLLALVLVAGAVAGRVFLQRRRKPA
jgi:hypothetical protein